MNWMVRVQVLQSKADALAPQPQPDGKWEVLGPCWSIKSFTPSDLCGSWVAHSLGLRVLEPRAFFWGAAAKV